MMLEWICGYDVYEERGRSICGQTFLRTPKVTRLLAEGCKLLGNDAKEDEDQFELPMCLYLMT